MKHKGQKPVQRTYNIKIIQLCQFFVYPDLTFRDQSK